MKPVVVNYTKDRIENPNIRVKNMNPRFWKGKVEMCDYYVSNDEEIIKTYEGAGVQHYFSKEEPEQEQKEQMDVQSYLKDIVESEPEFVIPDNWRELKYNDMVPYAKRVAKEPVSNKHKAIKAIEDYLKEIGEEHKL